MHLELTGIARFLIEEEVAVLTPYRQCKVDYFPFIDDFTARSSEEAVDREALIEVLGWDFLKANNLKVDWEGVDIRAQRGPGQRAGDDVVHGPP